MPRRGCVSQAGLAGVARAEPSAWALTIDPAEPGSVVPRLPWRKLVVGEGFGDQSPALKSRGGSRRAQLIGVAAGSMVSAKTKSSLGRSMSARLFQRWAPISERQPGVAGGQR